MLSSLEHVLVSLGVVLTTTLSHVIFSPLAGLRPGRDRRVLRRTGRPHLPGLLLLRHGPHVQLHRVQRAAHMAAKTVKPNLQTASYSSFRLTSLMLVCTAVFAVQNSLSGGTGLSINDDPRCILLAPLHPDRT